MDKSNKVTELFTTKKIILPIIIGVVITLYLLIKKTNWQELGKLTWNLNFLFFILIALFMMVIRDLAYMYRIRILTSNKISWRNSFDVIMLWEFASAITPSVVGGGGVALFILNKEGLSVGRSTALVMVTALLDELFYVITVPIIILFVGTQYLFPIEFQREIFNISFSVKVLFLLGYGFIVLLVIIISFGIFVNPQKIKSLLSLIFKINFLKRWKSNIDHIGNDIIYTSSLLKTESFSFWIRAFLATFISWTARFLVVNAIILAFIADGDHLLIYGRQLVMWVIMLISPTPGGTGVAEFVFSGFLKDFIPLGLAGLLAVLWRLISYYPYLFIGAFILPKWLKRVYT